MKASTKLSAMPKKAVAKKTVSSLKFKSMEEYIAALPLATQAIVKELRRTIQKVCPAAEVMISYNIPAVKLNANGLIWYAAWKEHINLYPRTTLESDH